MQKSASDDSVECKTHFKTSKKDGKISKSFKQKEFVAKPARPVKEFTKLCPFQEEMGGKEQTVLTQFVKDSKQFDAKLKGDYLVHVYRGTVVSDAEGEKCKVVVKFQVEGVKATYEFTKNKDKAGEFVIKKSE